ncbi:MAG: HNH endonuclease [Candidatus Thorarchaeota archaeon]
MTNRISKEQIVSELEEFYKRTGTSPILKDTSMFTFSGTTVRRLFGTWNRALTCAEIPLNANAKKTLVPCLNCGKEITRTAARIQKRGIKQFCGVPCSNRWRAENKPRKPKECPICKKENAKSSKYCCEECRKMGVRIDETITLQEYSVGCETWEFHGKLRGLAKTRIRESDREEVCARCGYSLFVECCHIKAISSFPKTATIAEVNSPSNLIYLCPNCHWEFDNGHWKDPK